MNKVMLIGNVGKEPDVKYVDQGVAVARLSLATTERGYTLSNGTQVPDRTDWHNIVLWRRLAEIVEKYVHKGDKIYVEGRLRYTTYDDKRGIRHSVTEIWAENMEMLTPKSSLPSQPNGNVGQTEQETTRNNGKNASGRNDDSTQNIIPTEDNNESLPF
ncbi:MAG: single-stranded DNA-binding protein [Prevotella sp.]